MRKANDLGMSSGNGQPGSNGRAAASSSGVAAPPNERHLQMDVMTCYTEAGAPLHLRCHILDITDRILTEQELSRAPRS